MEAISQSMKIMALQTQLEEIKSNELPKARMSVSLIQNKDKIVFEGDEGASVLDEAESRDKVSKLYDASLELEEKHACLKSENDVFEI